MEHVDHHRRDHGAVHKTDQHHPDPGTTAHKKEAPAYAMPRRPEGTHKTEGRKGAVHRAGNNGGAMHRGAAGGPGAEAQHDLKDLHLQHLTEHNIDKKHDDKPRRDEHVGKHLVTNRVPRGGDAAPHLLTNRTPKVSTSPNITEHKADAEGKNGTKDDIPMESERLIHVTARPPKVHKINKMHHKPSPLVAAAAVLSSHAQPSTPSTKAKAHKPPKKFSPKKHGWKKSLRKEKGKEKLKEKRERRDKRNKALHRAIVARKL
ncbi:uncharacterized protein [Procambarus clarkii]|uniref:uncharacterized protein isoform X2 n=1 Tax=Procambarus clarkii TaxID=6728 RepID=UPI00374345EF